MLFSFSFLTETSDVQNENTGRRMLEENAYKMTRAFRRLIEDRIVQLIHHSMPGFHCYPTYHLHRLFRLSKRDEHQYIPVSAGIGVQVLPRLSTRYAAHRAYIIAIILACTSTLLARLASTLKSTSGSTTGTSLTP